MTGEVGGAKAGSIRRMDETPLAAESESPQATGGEVPTLEYGRDDLGRLRPVLQGVCWLVAGAGVFGVPAAVIYASININGPGASIANYDWYMRLTMLVKGLAYALYAVGGLLCVSGRRGGTRVICAGAAMELLLVFGDPLLFQLLVVGERPALSVTSKFAVRLLYAVPMALLPLLLLWLFSRRLIRDAIGVE